MNHCTQLKIDHPDQIAPSITEWIEANPILDKITTVHQITTTEAVGGGITAPNGQPQAKYVFNFYIFWTSKPPANAAVS